MSSILASKQLPTIFDTLKAIEERPSMYLGADREHREEQLANLSMLLHGYDIALQAHGIEEGLTNGFSRNFGEYLQDRFGWSMSAGPVAAVLKNSAGGEDAWQLFWQLIKDYKEHLIETGA